MKFILFLLFCSVALAMKRRFGTTSSYVRLNRPCGNNALFLKAFLNENVEGFNQNFDDAKDFLTPDLVRELLRNAVTQGSARILKAALEKSVFRTALDVDLVELAFMSRKESILPVFLAAPYEEYEQAWYDDFDIVFQVVLRPLAERDSPFVDFVIRRLNFGFDDFLSVPTGGPEEHTSLEKCLLAYVHINKPKMSVQKYIGILSGIEDANENDFEPNAVVEAALKKDVESLSRVISESELDISQVIRIVLLAIMETQSYTSFKIPEEIPFKSTVIELDKYMVEQVLLQHALPEFRDFIANNFLFVSESADEIIYRLISKILDDAIAVGDLEKLLSVSRSLPNPYDYTPNQLIALNLSRNAHNGDYTQVLVFLEMNPKKYLLTESAWDLLMDASNPQAFLPLTQDVLQQRAGL